MVMRNCFTRKLFHVKQFLILVKLFLKDFVSRETLTLGSTSTSPSGVTGSSGAVRPIGCPATERSPSRPRTRSTLCR